MTCQCVCSSVLAQPSNRTIRHMDSSQPLVVGYVMKASRQQQLATAGLLHAEAVDGIKFVPLSLDAPLEQQAAFDILLHKASDELVSGPGGAAVFSESIQKLQQHLSSRPNICMVDPFEHTAKVLDRVQLCALLEGLSSLQLPGVTCRAPLYNSVSSFAEAGLEAALASKGMAAPYIVKPVVACGLHNSHSMALVLDAGAFSQLEGQMPAPAVIQEFANHGGMQHKVYVMGDQVFQTPRKSIPDVALPSTSSNSSSSTDGAHQQQPQQQKILLFDSLKSLPTELPASLQGSAASSTGNTQPLDPGTLEVIAGFLRERLGLTLFGFDVVVASRTGDWLVIDVNYFPNFRTSDGMDVAAGFRKALRGAWERHRPRI